ncbi:MULTISPECIES: ABC transporter substrate-binding protein [Amycolatopsis]|uniref:Peptide/nickel transport system substrate-binding protein n=2 Tax=Amycolatopsis TaxID=1813 RepID=A0A1I3UNR4_9PSEU|nr:ABC transporter substrate-binding protein [Amycolatopsis sacchari]SFJ83586.1 peptide/nickel transport system substrate-binding protein [Amycolatopsis sacchari]
MRRLSPGRRRAPAVLATATAMSLALFAAAACSPAGGGSPSSGSASKLTLQFTGPPISLNPALGGNGLSTMYTALAYDPLIYLSGDGKLVPDLATEWHYVGEGNKVFELTLRQGVKFTDGSPLTADAAVASMNYFLKAGGGLVSNAGPIDSITAAAPDKVRVTYKSANPDAAMTMTQYYGIGSIIGPKGLADPQSLLTTSDGTGQYVYNGKTSVANSRYDYDKNPAYFNPSAQMFGGVSIRVIGDAQAVLSATQTGQVQFAAGSSATVDAAKQANLTVLSAPFFNWNLILADAAGTVSKPLGDVRVRQAIAYALDRKGLANALGGQYAGPSTQVLLPGLDGYVPEAGYTYDLAKAKSLMAEAGYPDGFPLTVLTESVIDRNTTYSQAIVDALGAIGIKATLHVEATGIGQFSGDALSKQYAAIIFPSAGTDLFQVHNQISAGLFNPFGHKDEQLDTTLAQAFAADGAERTRLYQQASQRYQDLAWYVPVFSTENLLYVSPKLDNVKTSELNPNPMPVAPTPELAWRNK